MIHLNRTTIEEKLINEYRKYVDFLEQATDIYMDHILEPELFCTSVSVEFDFTCNVGTLHEIDMLINFDRFNQKVDSVEIDSRNKSNDSNHSMRIMLGLDYGTTLAYIKLFILIPYFWEAPYQKHLELMMSFYSGHSEPYDAYEKIATYLPNWYQLPLASLNLLLRSL